MMMRGAWIVVVVHVIGGNGTSALAAEPTKAPWTPAAQAEDQAFQAVEGERWCEAMRLFEKAYSLAPAVDLLVNAARAAEYGGDLRAAVRLLADVQRSSDAPRAKKLQAKKTAAGITKRIAKNGEGATCPDLPAPALAAAAAPVPSPAPAPIAAVTSDAPASVDAGVSSSTPEPPEADSMRASSSGPRVWGWVGAGTGAAIAVIGGTAMGFGLVPWFAHQDASQKIRQAEKTRDSASAFQKAQIDARTSWTSWGQMTTVAGLTAVGAGTVALAGGLVWVLGSEDPGTSGE